MLASLPLSLRMFTQAKHVHCMSQASAWTSHLDSAISRRGEEHRAYQPPEDILAEASRAPVRWSNMHVKYTIGQCTAATHEVLVPSGRANTAQEPPYRLMETPHPSAKRCSSRGVGSSMGAAAPKLARPRRASGADMMRRRT